MFRFIWLFIKTVLSATLLLLACIMLSAIFRFGWGGGIFVGLLALILIAMAIVPWLFSRPKRKEPPITKRKFSFSIPIPDLPEPQGTFEKIVFIAVFGALFGYALSATYWSATNLFSLFSVPHFTDGTVKSVSRGRGNHKLVIATAQGEMKFHLSCSPLKIGPGEEITVGWRESQRYPFDGLPTTLVIYQNKALICGSADRESWKQGKLAEAFSLTLLSPLLVLSADWLLIALGLKRKFKVLLGLESGKRTP